MNTMQLQCLQLSSISVWLLSEEIQTEASYVDIRLQLTTLSLSSLVGGLPYEFKVVIAGNHELTFDKDFMAELVKQDYYRFPSVSKLKPEDFDNVQSLLTNCVYLQDSDVTIKGFRIYGAPW